MIRKISRGVIISCLLAAATLSCESAYQKLESLDHLKNIDFGRSVPKHSLLLLHWFANTVDIDNNGVHLTFDPNTDFGSHYYGNFEDLLDPLPVGHVRHQYYTVGNLHTETSNELPDYILNPLLQDYQGTNRDRIIFRVREPNTEVHRIDQVYLTQHYYPHEHQGTRYNPEHTYQISTSLLQQIRMFSDESLLTELRDRFHSNANDVQLRLFRNTWGQHLACIGLLLFIVIQEKYSNNRLPKKQLSENRPEPEERIETQPDYESDISIHYETDDLETVQTDELQFDLTDTNENTSHPYTQGVSEVQVVKNEMERNASNTLNQSSEDVSTAISVPPNNSLLRKIRPTLPIIILSTFIVLIITVIIFLLFIILTIVIILVLTFSDGRCIQIPDGVPITDYNARLQLFVRDGKACARLYLNQSFTEWRSEFNQSWVGFYKSAEKDTDDYEWWQWQWATKFEPCFDCEDYNQYNCFKYCSRMVAAPTVQVRFMLRDNIVKARTMQCDKEKNKNTDLLKQWHCDNNRLKAPLSAAFHWFLLNCLSE